MSKRGMNWTKVGKQTVVHRRELEHQANVKVAEYFVRFDEGPYKGQLIKDVFKIDPQYCLDQITNDLNRWDSFQEYYTQSQVELAIIEESREFFRRFRALSKIRPELEPQEIAKMVLSGLGIDNVVIGLKLVEE